MIESPFQQNSVPVRPGGCFRGWSVFAFRHLVPPGNRGISRPFSDLSSESPVTAGLFCEGGVSLSFFRTFRRVSGTGPARPLSFPAHALMLLHALLPRSAACARGLRHRRPAGGSLAERFPSIPGGATHTSWNPIWGECYGTFKTDCRQDATRNRSHPPVDGAGFGKNSGPGLFRPVVGRIGSAAGIRTA